MGSQEVTDFLRASCVLNLLSQGGDKEIGQFEGGCHFALPDATEQNLEKTLSFGFIVCATKISFLSSVIEIWCKENMQKK